MLQADMSSSLGLTVGVWMGECVGGLVCVEEFALSWKQSGFFSR